MVDLIIEKDKDELFTFDNYPEDEYITKSFLKPKWDFLLFADGFDEKRQKQYIILFIKIFKVKEKKEKQ